MLADCLKVRARSCKYFTTSLCLTLQEGYFAFWQPDEFFTFLLLNRIRCLHEVQGFDSILPEWLQCVLDKPVNPANEDEYEKITRSRQQIKCR